MPANGMYLVTDDGVAMFDTPWDTTHFHDNRTGGLEYYRMEGVRTCTTVITDELSRKNRHKRAEFLIVNDTVFSLGKYRFVTYYPAQGHSPDNIVIWFEKQRILYGACLIKTVYDRTLGYLGDANKTEYAATVKNVINKCKDPSYVITGHSDWNQVRALKHTWALAKKLCRRSM